MKRIALFAAAVALALPVPLVLPTAASAQLNPGRASQEGCKVLFPDYLGGCVSFVNVWWNSFDHGFITKNCDSALELEPELFFLEYDSMAECVRDGAAAFPFPEPPE